MITSFPNNMDYILLATSVTTIVYHNILRLVADLSLGNKSSSRALSVMSKSNGQERFISDAFLVTLATVFRDTPQLCAMFRSLNPRLFKRRISRYWVIVVTSFICIHTKVCVYSIKETICNRAKSGSELPESVAPIPRNGGSQSPDRRLNEPRNNQLNSVELRTRSF